MNHNLILMFHRVFEPQLGFNPSAFADFLRILKREFSFVAPFEQCQRHKGNRVVLTFDDAYFDFYHFAYPILKDLKIPSVLAVSAGFIEQDSNVPPEVRLSVPYPEGMFNPEFAAKSPFCTWSELNEMISSGYVEIASHGYWHHNLADPNTDFEKEVVASKILIENRCATHVKGFIYPFGKTTRGRHAKVLKHYEYAMRIGGATNLWWHRTLYRIDAEKFWPTCSPISWQNQLKWQAKYWINKLRFK